MGLCLIRAQIGNYKARTEEWPALAFARTVLREKPKTYPSITEGGAPCGGVSVARRTEEGMRE